MPRISLVSLNLEGSWTRAIEPLEKAAVIHCHGAERIHQHPGRQEKRQVHVTAPDYFRKHRLLVPPKALSSQYASCRGGTRARPSENNKSQITDHKSQINRACFLGISYL